MEEKGESVYMKFGGACWAKTAILPGVLGKSMVLIFGGMATWTLTSWLASTSSRLRRRTIWRSSQSAVAAAASEEEAGHDFGQVLLVGKHFETGFIE